MGRGEEKSVANAENSLHSPQGNQNEKSTSLLNCVELTWIEVIRLSGVTQRLFLLDCAYIALRIKLSKYSIVFLLVRIFCHC